MKDAMKEYYPQLDGLRFMAVFMVMFAHYAQYQMGNIFITSIPMVYGVILFFVLSGFLITRILLLQKGKPISTSLKSFYTRRVLRIFPVFYVVLLILYIIDHPHARELMPWLSSYSINIYESWNNTNSIGDFNHIWSLAVEEQFYLLWPLAILLVPKKYLLRLIISLIGFSLLFKIYLSLNTPYWVWNDVGLITNYYSLGVGAVLAYISIEKPKMLKLISSNVSLLITGALVIVTVLIEMFFDYNLFKEAIMPFIWVLFFAAIIAKSTFGFKGVVGWFLTNRVVIYLGKISYGIYIIHQFIPTFFYSINPDSIFIQNKYIGFLGFSIVTVILASISWFGLEKPINGLKKRFRYSN